MIQSKMDKNLACHSPHKNKVLKHSFFGSIFGNFQKSKLVEYDCQTKPDGESFGNFEESKEFSEGYEMKDNIEDNSNFSQIQNSKFPIVSLKLLSRKDVENYKGEGELNGINHKLMKRTVSIFSCSSDSESDLDIVEVEEIKPFDLSVEPIIMQDHTNVNTDEHTKQPPRQTKGKSLSSIDSEDDIYEEALKPSDIPSKSSKVENIKNCNKDSNWQPHTTSKEFYTLGSSSNSEDENELPDIQTSDSSLKESKNKELKNTEDSFRNSVHCPRMKRKRELCRHSCSNSEDEGCLSTINGSNIQKNLNCEVNETRGAIIDEVNTSKVHGKNMEGKTNKDLSSNDLEIEYLSSENKNCSYMNISELNCTDDEDEIEDKTKECNVDVYDVSSDSDIEVISSRGPFPKSRDCTRGCRACKIDDNARESSSLITEFKRNPDLLPSVSVTFKNMKSCNFAENCERKVGIGISAPDGATKMSDDNLRSNDTPNQHTGNELRKEDEVDAQQCTNADNVEKSGLSNGTLFDEGMGIYKSLITESTKSVYKCSRCDYTSKVRGHAKSHSLIHATFKLFRCSKCTFRSNRKDKLRLHVMKVHKLDSSCFSRYCYATTKNIDVAKEISYCNSITEESVKVYQCSVCAYVTEEKSEIERHIAIHSEMDVSMNKSNECCNDTPKHSERKSEHRNPFDHLYNTIENFEITKTGCQATKKQMSIFKCSVCNYQTIKRDRAKRHALTHSETKLFRCPKCDYDTNRSENVKIHWNSVHAKELVVDVQENNENNEVQNDSTITYSLDSQMYGESFKCCLCGYQTDVRTEAEEHLTIHLNSRGDDSNSDSKRKTAVSKTYRSRRRRNLETKRMEIVERCYKTINEIMITDSRTESITDWKSLYVCSVCNYQTEMKHVARRHSLNHSETKIFKCDLCEYTTNRKDMLRSHEKRHKPSGKTLPRRGRKKLIQPIHSNEKGEYTDNTQTMEYIAKNSDRIQDIQNQSNNYNMDILQTNYDSGTNERACTESPLPESQSEFKALIDDSFSEIKDPLHESIPDLKIPLDDSSQITSPVEDLYSYTHETYSCSQYDPKESVKERNSLETPSNAEANVRKVEKVYSFSELLKCAEYDYQSYKGSEEIDPSEIKNPEDDDASFNPGNKKLLRCIECVYKTYERNDMRTHLGTHINSSLLECPECNFETTSESILIKHRKDCDANYGANKGKRRSKQGFQCPECVYQSKYKKVLDKHLRTHTDGRRRIKKSTKYFYCSQCDYKNIIKANVNRHARTHEKKIFQCPTCSYVTYYRFAMMNHSRSCRKSFQRDVDAYRQTFEQQYIYEDNNSYPEFSNDINNNNSNSFPEFSNDINNNSITNISDNTNINSTYISDNINTDSDNTIDENMLDESGFIIPSMRVLKCAQCNFQTYLRSRLKKHLQVHSTESTNSEELIDLSGCVCDMCLNSLSDSAGAHLSAQEVFKCSKCSFATHLQDYLRTHEQIHLEFSDWGGVFQEVDYVCE